MGYSPLYTVNSKLVRRLEQIAAARERIRAATLSVEWVPALQLEARARNAHCSTAIEGNPLTLEQVRAVEEGRDLPAVAERSRREVENYFAGLKFIEAHPESRRVKHDDVLALHRIIAGGVMDQGDTGDYRSMQVKVGTHRPPLPEEVKPLMTELLDWWNQAAAQLSPVFSSAILHYRFEEIHPFADGNGRVGRALALWDLYRRGFDTQHIFSVDEFYWDDRPRYYRELEKVQVADGNLTGWLEYCSEGLLHTLEMLSARIQRFSVHQTAPRLVLRPRQEQLLALLQQSGGMTPSEIWAALDISKQGALDLLNPLMEAGLVVREGTRKSGRYRLRALVS